MSLLGQEQTDKRDLAIQFGQCMLTYIQQVLYANKSTFNDDLLAKCVALYEQLYRHSQLQDETEDTIVPYWTKLIKRWNIVCKQDANGVALNPSDRKSQIGLRRAAVSPLIYQDDHQAFLEYANQSELRTLPGIPVSFLLGEGSPYAGLLWKQFQYLFQTTQAFIGALIDEAFTTECEDQITKLELEHQIGLLIRDDPYLNTVLYSPSKDAKGICDQATKAMREAGIENEDVFNIVSEATNHIFESADGDVENINTAETTMIMLKSAKDILKKKGSTLKKCGDRKTMGQLLTSLSNVTTKGVQVPAAITNMIALAQTAVNSNDPSSVQELEKVTSDMGLSKEMIIKMIS